MVARASKKPPTPGPRSSSPSHTSIDFGHGWPPQNTKKRRTPLLGSVLRKGGKNCTRHTYESPTQTRTHAHNATKRGMKGRFTAEKVHFQAQPPLKNRAAPWGGQFFCTRARTKKTRSKFCTHKRTSIFHFSFCFPLLRIR